MPDQDNSSGLTAAAAAERLSRDGPNELPRTARRGILRIVAEIMRQPMFCLLIGGGVVYLLLGDRLEAILLLLFACLSVTITIVQESRSERVLEALRDLASPRALVIRDGQRVLIAGREVVVGDLLVVGEGDRVAADATLSESNDLLLDESLLTGESVPVRKLARPAGEPGKADSAPRPGGDDLPFVFAGTLVVRGRGVARVHATGGRSEMGKIGHALGAIETEQPQLQVQLRSLVLAFAVVGGLAGSLTVLLFGLLRGSWLDALLAGIALGMSLLPEEFPLVMTVFMAMGAWRISRARVLTRRAAAIETLGATTVLCTDKTGTLTENRMTVAALRSGAARWDQAGGPVAAGALDSSLSATLEAALLACPVQPTDPMDVAVHKLWSLQGVGKSPFAGRRLLRAYGLRPELLAVANVYAASAGGQPMAFAKGGFEAIAALCQLTSEQIASLGAEVDRLAAAGVRVLGIATATLEDGSRELPETPSGLPFQFTGLIGFADPLRANVPAAVSECRSAGIRVVMITGDYPATATAMARQAGIDATSVMTGEQIDTLPDEELAKQVKSTSVFARIRPNQKLRIVQSLKAGGEIVAMTGDGVNDAPAIKAAHIGIAMGGRGTDVAREASAIVLLDDDFGFDRRHDPARPAHLRQPAQGDRIHHRGAHPHRGTGAIAAAPRPPPDTHPDPHRLPGNGDRSSLLDRIRGGGSRRGRHAAATAGSVGLAAAPEPGALGGDARRSRSGNPGDRPHGRGKPGRGGAGPAGTGFHLAGRDQHGPDTDQPEFQLIARAGVPTPQPVALDPAWGRQCAAGRVPVLAAGAGTISLWPPALG